MPVQAGIDRQGCYMQWGTHGKKYRYKCGNKLGRALARRKATKQGAVAFASGYRGK